MMTRVGVPLDRCGEAGGALIDRSTRRNALKHRIQPTDQTATSVSLVSSMPRRHNNEARNIATLYHAY